MEGQVALKIVHTADWHLGRRFRAFRDEDEKKLTRERLAVVERILRLANQHQADAVLCAGDLFDCPEPDRQWWEGLADHIRSHGRAGRPIFLLPGNHDPLKVGSVYSAEHPFRRQLPSWAHVVDRDDFCFELNKDSVVYAAPCRSQAGQEDLTLKLPAREPGDERLRIGLVHGQTFDIKGHQQNFPISKGAAYARGFDYLAIGDTHAFRRVETGTPVPVVYPGSPEPAKFDETEAGSVALVFFPRRPREPVIQRERVGRYRWMDCRCQSMEALRALCAREDLSHTVLRLELDLAVSLQEEAEVGQLVKALSGSHAMEGRTAALLLERKRVSLHTGDFDELLPSLPAVLRSVVETLQAKAAGAGDAGREATRALRHLYQLVVEPQPSTRPPPKANSAPVDLEPLQAPGGLTAREGTSDAGPRISA